MEFNFNEEKDRFGPETVPIPRLIERGRKNRGRPCISCGLSIKFIIKQRSSPKQLTIQIQVYLSRCSGKLSFSLKSFEILILKNRPTGCNRVN